MELQEKTDIPYLEMSIGKIVAKDYRKAMVFKSFGIDFCCGGAAKLKDVVQEHNLNEEDILPQLEKLDLAENTETDYETWPLDKLVDHIIDKHHRYVTETIKQLSPMLDKVEMVHGNWRPELHEINNLFKEISRELLQHMKKEEMILFPAIKSLFSEGKDSNERFAFIQNPITIMEHEHDVAGDLMKRIRDKTDGYSLPKGACATYTVTYKVLNEFENDLHTHIHLENNILFPKALEIVH